jgi:FkbM family methyltransferase
VIAVEPEPSNAALCAANLTVYGSRGIVINAAIWGHCCHVSIDKDAKDQGYWAIRVRPAEFDQCGIPALDIPEIMRMAGTEHIDLLKIDVEGSETALFTDSCHAWLPKVRNLSIELHGPECSKAFYSAMARYRYEREQCGEIVNCRNISPIATYN